MKNNHNITIPPDFEVRPLGPDENPPGRTTCGHCGLSWDDDISTSYTPAPSGRCPFEYFHVDEEKAKRKKKPKPYFAQCNPNGCPARHFYEISEARSYLESNGGGCIKLRQKTTWKLIETVFPRKESPQ